MLLERFVDVFRQCKQSLGNKDCNLVVVTVSQDLR